MKKPKQLIEFSDHFLKHLQETMNKDYKHSILKYYIRGSYFICEFNVFGKEGYINEIEVIAKDKSVISLERQILNFLA